MAKKEVKEMCPKCACAKFSVATDKSNKHYCDQCKHIWIPGVNVASRLDLVLQQAQKENLELKAELVKLRKKLEVFESTDEAEEIYE
ncbi:MAG: hypothetical protein KDA17_00590 [Candidatus Saccharibacteria bacterium]|nr:hypothetical protein [Candidatus Saccharibacteria bacterium]